MKKKGSTNKDKTVQVGEREFRWHIHRQPQWCTADGWKGLAVHVELANEAQRVLIIEFPLQVTNHRSTPHRQRPSVSEKGIVNAIFSALAGGWEPESRGKAFVFEAEIESAS